MNTVQISQIEFTVEVLKWAIPLICGPLLAGFVYLIYCIHTLKNLDKKMEEVQKKMAAIPLLQRDSEEFKANVGSLRKRLDIVWMLSDEKFPKKFPDK